MAGTRRLSWIPGVDTIKDLSSGVTKRLWDYFTPEARATVDWSESEFDSYSEATSTDVDEEEEEDVWQETETQWVSTIHTQA